MAGLMAAYRQTVPASGCLLADELSDEGSDESADLRELDTKLRMYSGRDFERIPAALESCDDAGSSDKELLHALALARTPTLPPSAVGWNADNMGAFCVLPSELVFEILCCLDRVSLVRMRQVSRPWAALCANPSFWRGAIVRDEPQLARLARASFVVPALVSLRVRGLKTLGDAAFSSSVCLFAALSALKLERCDALGSDAMRALVVGCPRLVSLSLVGCWRIDATGYGALGNLASLAALSVVRAGLDARGVLSLLGSDVSTPSPAAASLRSLTFDHCARFDRLALEAIANGAQQLARLKLDACPRVCADGLRAVGGRCRGLRTLSLMRARVADLAVAELVAALPLLTSLNCRRVHVGDETLDALARSCRNLRRVNLRGTGAHTAAALGRLIAQCPRLESLDVSKSPLSADELASALARARALRSVKLLFCSLSARVFDTLAALPALRTVALADVADEMLLGLAGSLAAACPVPAVRVVKVARDVAPELAATLAETAPRVAFVTQ